MKISFDIFSNRNYSKQSPSTNYYQKGIFPLHDSSNANSWNILRNLENILDLLIYSVAQTSDWRRWQVEVSTQQESIFFIYFQQDNNNFCFWQRLFSELFRKKATERSFSGWKKHKRSCFYKRLPKDLDNSNQFLLL